LPDKVTVDLKDISSVIDSNVESQVAIHETAKKVTAMISKFHSKFHEFWVTVEENH
jgi:hypothetical protein